MRIAALCLALVVADAASAEPMKIPEPEDGRASDQYWSPALRVTPGRHLMERRAPIGAPDVSSGEAGWAGPATANRPIPVISPQPAETKDQIRRRVMSRPVVSLRYFIGGELDNDYRDECFVLASQNGNLANTDKCISDEETAINILNRDWMKITPAERRNCAALAIPRTNLPSVLLLPFVASCVEGSLN